MLLTLNEVKDFLKDSLEDLGNQEAAEKTKAEATEEARDELSRRGWDDLSRSVRGVEPKKEVIQRSVPVSVVAKGKPGIRQDHDGHTAVWVYNNLTGDHSPSISGTCTFWFKEIDKDEPEGAPEKVNRDDAVIPIHSILVFEPTDQKRCVSEFRLQLLIKKNGKDERVPEVGYDDPGCGKCLTKFVFHCIDDNSGPLDWDPS